MKEMKIRNKLIIGMAMLGIACVGVGAMMAKPFSAKAETAETAATETQGLTGFTSPGASVFIATDGTDTKQMRFQVNLDSTADDTYKNAAANKSLQSGVAVLPYDIYQANGYTELTKDTPQAVTAEVTENWVENENGYESYAYLPIDLIPQDQYNRILIARGYVIDGENVYYTQPVRASMAYVAWKSSQLPEFADYLEQLKGYMGPYTLSYNGGSIPDLYYGDTVSLPTTINDYNVVGWYWDEARTEAIAETDYATGTMPVYYKLQEFTVSGTVSCADSVDMTTVKIAVDGVETDATFEANGAYSVSVEPGTHKFTFSCTGYKAYALNTAVSEDLTLDAELKSDLYEIGNFGNVASTVGLVPEDDFDGQYTVEGNNYLLMMPNTATTDAFTYTVKVSNLTSGRGDKAFAASVSNGTYALSIGFYQYETIVVNLSSKAGPGFIGYYNMTGSQQYIDDTTIKIVKTENDIKVYVGSILYFTFTSEGIALADGVTDRNWGNSFVANQDKLAGFFGENVKLACGIAAVNGDAFTATYNCKIEKYFEVGGTITADASVDLTQTVLTVDGVATAMTVNADGTYTAYVPEGTHTLTFTKGVWSATKEATIVSGSNTVDVTLVNGTWRVGNYGSVKSTQTPELQENGTYTVDGKNQLLIFPNTATSESFTYSVKVTGLTRTNDAGTFGICISNGKYSLTVGFRKWTYMDVSIITSAGTKWTTYYNDTSRTNSNTGGTIKFMISADKIEFYREFYQDTTGPKLVLTFTSAGITGGENVTHFTGWPDTLTANYATGIAGFFETGAKIACGIASGYNNSVKATYACTITKN